MNNNNYAIRILLVLPLILSLAGCSGSHRKDSDFIFRPGSQEPMVDLGYYRPVQDRPGQNPNIAVAVAISGGGYRAANYSAGVLCGLERLGIANSGSFLGEVDYYSTVSGGGFTTGLIMSLQHGFLSDNGTLNGFSFCRNLCTKEGAGRKLRNSVVFGYLKSLGKTGLSFKAYKLITNNRTEFIEQIFEDIFLTTGPDKKKRSLVTGDLFVPAGSTQKPLLPYWFQNATVFENGAIFPHTPDIYKAYGVNRYTHRLKKHSIESEDDYFNIPLALGMTSSATYPPVMSPVKLRIVDRDNRNRYLYLIDGGLSDFLGVITALRVLEQETADRKVLLIIDAGFMDNEPYSKGPWGPYFTNVFRRTLDISTDSWRTRYKDFITKYAKGAGIENFEVIPLDFQGLSDECKNDIKDIVARFNISRKDQNALFRAGMESVSLNAKELYCSLSPDSLGCHGPESEDFNLEVCPGINTVEEHTAEMDMTGHIQE